MHAGINTDKESAAPAITTFSGNPPGMIAALGGTFVAAPGDSGLPEDWMGALM